MYQFLVFTVSLLSFPIIQGSDIIDVGAPNFFGSGCPKGTVKVEKLWNGHIIAVSFTEYHAETSNEHPRQRKSCNVAIPIDVPAGTKVGVTSVTYNGYTDVPNNVGSHAQFRAEYFFSGHRGPVTSTTYPAGYEGELNISHKINSVIWSPCGKSTIFRVNTALLAKKLPSTEDNVFIGIDSTSINSHSKFYYFISTQNC